MLVPTSLLIRCFLQVPAPTGIPIRALLNRAYLLRLPHLRLEYPLVRRLRLYGMTYLLVLLLLNTGVRR